MQNRIFVERLNDWRREPNRSRTPDPAALRNLLDIVRLPEGHADEGYHFHTRPAHVEALMQLLEWRDERLVPALEEIARHPEAERARADIEETIRLVRERLGI